MAAPGDSWPTPNVSTSHPDQASQQGNDQKNAQPRSCKVPEHRAPSLSCSNVGCSISE
jgi:hypothetical protein